MLPYGSNFPKIQIKKKLIKLINPFNSSMWFQCNICKIVCNSLVAMSVHEKKHLEGEETQGRVSADLWTEMKLTMENVNGETEEVVLDIILNANKNANQNTNKTEDELPTIEVKQEKKKASIPEKRTSPRRTPKKEKRSKVPKPKQGPIIVKIEKKNARIRVNGEIRESNSTSSKKSPSTSTSTATPARNNCCEICGFIGRNITDMKEHSRTHTKEKPFKCPACESRFSRTQNMRHHIRFNCPEAEKNGMAQEYNKKAREHAEKTQIMSTMEGASDFPCSICVEKFSNTIKLGYHMRVHSLGKNGAVHNCKFCKADFYSKRSVIDHTARVHNENVQGIPCEICGKNLSTKCSLRRHIRLNHSGSDFTTPTSSQGPSSSLVLVQNEDPSGIMEQVEEQEVFTFNHCFIEQGDHDPLEIGIEEFVIDEFVVKLEPGAL